MTALPRPLVTLLLGALATAAALAGLLAGAGPAAAHAALDTSTPEDGAVVATAPDEVTLTFTEGVSLGADGIRVLDPDGDRADAGGPTGSGRDHAVALRPGLADGTYTVAWQVVSTDSHPISGAFTFSIGAPSETAVDADAVTTAGDDGLVGLLYDAGRYAAYTGFLLLVGSCVFVLVCWPAAATRRAVQRVTLAGWTILTGATLALLCLRTPYTGSGELADAFDLAGLRDVVGTRTGSALVTRLLLAGAAGLFIALLYGAHARLRAAQEAAAARDADGKDDGNDGNDGDRDEAVEDGRARLRDVTFGLGIGGAILAVGLAATWATAEHAATGRQTAVAIPADVVHLLAVAAWLGGLVTLLAILHDAPDTPPGAAVRRYSALATGSVAALAATGLYQSWRQVGLSWTALTDTSYGRLLLLKVALIATLLVVASVSRRWTHRLADAPASRPGEPTDDAAPETVAVGGEGVAPARARQLARQRAAIDRTARLRSRERARGADPHRAALRRSVLAEAAIAAVLLGVTTALTATPPAHTAAAEAAAADSAAGGGDQDRSAGDPLSLSLPYDTGGEAGRGDARLDISPAATGDNTLHIRLTDPNGRPTNAEEIRVALTLPAEDLGPLRYETLHVDVGHWTVTDLQLPRPGSWDLALTIRTSDIDQTTETTSFTIP
ncbi:copper resistance CopC/CopD family protein [Streptomyces hainanensis]|nr:copper resistance protein CopC [Streptomyces hainanensis]